MVVELKDHTDAFANWVEDNRDRIPELKLLLAVDNGSESLLLLPVPKHGHGGLFLEFNQESQPQLLSALMEQNYSVVACKVWYGAKNAVEAYLGVN